jgi:hypothetical protein
MSVRCSPEDLVTVVLEGHPTHIQRAFPSKLALHQGPTGCQVHDSSGSLAIKRRYGQLVIKTLLPKGLIGSTTMRNFMTSMYLQRARAGAGPIR